MAIPGQYFSNIRFPLTQKPLTHPDKKNEWQDIFNLQNSFRLLIQNLGGSGFEIAEEPDWVEEGGITPPGKIEKWAKVKLEGELYYVPLFKVEEPVPIVGDPHWDNVVALLHFDGADGSTTFTDSSPAPKAVTVHGDAKISTAQSKWGGASAYFSGNYSKLQVPSDQSLAFGTGDFTVECLVFSSPATGGGVAFDKLIFGGFATNPDFVCFLVNDNLAPALWDGSVGIISQIAVQPSTWTHVAWCRASGVLRIFVNGQKGVEVSRPTHFNPGINYIGGEVDSRFFTGYIDELRITKGVARYTENFIPPTEPFPNFGP